MSSALLFQFRGRVLRRRTLTHLGNHSRIWADLHRTSASKAVYANPPDHPEMIVWAAYLKPGDLFVDIGANVGTYTIWAGDRGAKVIALEPAADTFELLKENVALNGYPAELICAAAGRETGVARFTIGEDCGNRFRSDGLVQVPMVALDDVIGPRLVDGMKIDVEGFEIEVLTGCKRALAEGRVRLLQLEWNSASEAAVGTDRTEVTNLLMGCGYHLFRPDAHGDLVALAEYQGYGTDVFAKRD